MIPYTDDIHIYRRKDNYVYEGEVQTVTLGQYFDDCLLQVSLDSAQTGTLYLEGSTFETLTFTSARYAETTKHFTQLEGMTPSGLSGIMTISKVNIGGELIESLERINTIKGSYNPKSTKQFFQLYGMDQNFRGIIETRADADVMISDLVKIEKLDMDGYYEVKEIYTPKCFGHNTHKELILMYNK